MDETIEKLVGGYLRGYEDGFKAGVQYALETAKRIMREKGMIAEEEPRPC